MAENFVDFRAVKQAASIVAVLEHYRVTLRSSGSNALRGRCPLPTHHSETSNESFGVQTEKNIWACQSNSCAAARQGKKGGNVIDFVAIMESCSVRDAATKLHEWFCVNPQREPVPKKKLVAEKEQGSDANAANAPLTFTLKNIDPTHAYLQQRDITEETARQFGVGYFPGRGSMSGRVVIPIQNWSGQLVAYAGRSIDNTEPKYKLPTGFQKSLELFNIHRALESTRERVIVVEGFFDCMKVSQAGFPNVIALMGSSLSQTQQKLLLAFEHLVLFLDGDEAGRGATKLLADQLARKRYVKIVEAPDGTQPDSLPVETMRTLLKRDP